MCVCVCVCVCFVCMCVFLLLFLGHDSEYINTKINYLPHTVLPVGTGFKSSCFKCAFVCVYVCVCVCVCFKFSHDSLNFLIISSDRTNSKATEKTSKAFI